MNREAKSISLAWRFLIWFVVIALLPLALFGYLSLRQNEEVLRVEALSRMSRLADKKALQIKTYLAERIQDVGLMARGGLPEEVMPELSRAYARHRADPEGYRKTAKPADKAFSAYIGVNDDTLFYDAFLITPQGEIIYTYRREPDFSTNLIDGPWRDSQLARVFSEACMTFGSSVSDFEHYAPSNEPAAFVAAPIVREGKLLGVLAFQLDTQAVYRVAMDSSGLGVTGETLLAKMTDADEALFVAPLRHDPQAAMRRKIDLKSGAVPIRMALSGKRGSGVEADYSGKQVVAAWRYLPELRWGMVVKMDTDEAFASIYQQRKNLLEVLLALAVLGGFAAFLFGRHMVRRLKNFAQNADEIAQGDLSRRVNESGRDEIGALAHSFNRMTGNLQNLYRTLEDRVEERTRELNVSNEQLQEEIIEREHIEKSLRESQEHTVRALEELHRSETRLRTLYDSTSDAVMMLDERGFFDCNKATLAMFGCATKEEFCSKHPADLSPSEQPCGTNSMVLAKQRIVTAMEQDTYQFEWVHRRADTGVIFPAEVLLNRMELDGRQVLQATVRDITERKRMENEIAQREALFRSYFELGQIGMAITSLERGWLNVNNRLCEMLGYTREELSKMTWTELTYQDDLEPDLVQFRKLMSGESDRYSMDKRFIRKDGSLIHTYLAVSCQRKPDGSPDYFIASLQDITERRLVQLELQHSQNLLNEAQRLGHLGSWELNLASGELRWSDEIYRIFELDPAQFLPSYENFLNVIHPDDRDKVNQAYTQSLEDRLPYDILHRLLMEDGRIKWVREHCTSEFDASGKPLRSVGAVQDITAQHLAEEQLRIAAATFETHEAILITDANANIIRVNQAFQDITGYTSEEVLGKNPRILSSGRQDKAFYAAMWQQLLNTGSWSGEIWDRRKGGQVYPKWLNITVVKNEAGEVTEYVAIFSDITARKQAEEEIHNLAFYDALTTLPNRRLLLDRFRLALSVSARSHHYGAVLFLDMDKFKTLNDTLGHDYGDLMLIEVAKRLQSCVRETDTVARLGGDEFVVLLEEVDANAEEASQKVALIAEKIRSALAAPYRLKDHEHHSSPSIGVSLYRGNAESVDALLKFADMAMYEAKEAGRNAVRFFDPAMQLAVETRAAIEADLRHAVPDKQLRLYYQIQLDNDHHPLGAEALVRWIHPKRGMVSPAQFIPIAEESSLILDVGHWVLETACRQLAVWGKSEQTRRLELAINVSSQQFTKHDFVENVATMARVHQIDPSRLKLELTESVVLNDVADIVAKMHALKALGIKLSLDDFGTGYSSLSYLKQLPLDQLKIDQSFVRDIATDLNDAVMVQTIIGMAKNFRLNVIAEGVETEAQLKFLKQNGCMAYQGYLFGKPVPLEEFEALLGKMM